jgi:hypothetical protein
MAGKVLLSAAWLAIARHSTMEWLAVHSSTHPDPTPSLQTVPLPLCNLPSPIFCNVAAAVLQVVVTANRLELRISSSKLLGAIPLKAIAAFGRCTEVQECLAVVYIKANNITASWVLAFPSPEETKAAFVTLGGACSSGSSDAELPARSASLDGAGAQPNFSTMPPATQRQQHDGGGGVHRIVANVVAVLLGDMPIPEARGDMHAEQLQQIADLCTTRAMVAGDTGHGVHDEEAVHVAVTTTRVELRTNENNKLFGAVPLAAVVSFVPSTTASPDCIAVIYRRPNNSFSSWVLRFASPADRMVALQKFCDAVNPSMASAYTEAVCRNLLDRQHASAGAGSASDPPLTMDSPAGARQRTVSLGARGLTALPEYRPPSAPQTRGCAIRCGFIGIIDSTEVEGTFKDEQARLDAALAFKPIPERSQCTEIVITVIKGEIKFQTTADNSWGSLANGRSTTRSTSTKRSITSEEQATIALASILERTCVKSNSVKFCGHGTKSGGVASFGLLFAQGSNFLYFTFTCDTEGEAMASVQALARAFGAGQKQDELMNELSYKDAVEASSYTTTGRTPDTNHPTLGGTIRKASSATTTPTPTSEVILTAKQKSSTITSLPDLKRTKSNQSTGDPSSTAIEITHIQYLGHMEIVSDKVADAIATCERLLSELPGTSAATVAIRHNVVEFLDPVTKQIAKWFLMSSIDSLQVSGTRITLVVARGKIPKLRFFCYAFLADSETKAKQLSSIIITGIKSWRRQTIKRFEDVSLKTPLHEILASSGTNEDWLQEVLQTEIDSMTEDYRAITIKRFQLQKLHCKEAEQNRAMLALVLLHIYESSVENGAKAGWKGFLSKSLLKSSHLASSLESLVTHPPQKAGKLSTFGNRARSNSSTGTSPKLGRRNKKQSKCGEEHNIMVESRPFRQQLFKTVTAKAPRPNTPGRRASSVFLEVMQTTPPSRKTTIQARKAVVRSRWHKAFQQQLMLNRMAQQNARLDAISARIAEEADAQATLAQKMAKAEQWQPIWAIQPSKWDIAELRKCIRAGVPDGARGRLWLGLVNRYVGKVGGDEKYVDLLLKPCIYRHAIKIDLGRTFPGDDLFADPKGGGQKSLYNCLAAYSNLDEEVGYCQGMNFMGGMFLYELNEENAFRAFSSCLQEHGLRHQYMPDMHQLQVQLYQFSRLLRDCCPQVFDHLVGCGIDPFLYATPWFLSAFCSQFPMEVCRRIFDFLLLDGVVVLFKLACGLLKRNAAAICNHAEFERTLTCLQKDLPGLLCPAPDDVVGLMDEVLITVDMLDQYTTEFELMNEQLPTYTNQDNAGKEMATLLDKLMDAEQAKKKAVAETDVMQQQLNAAKTALQGLEEELLLAKEETAMLRASAIFPTASPQLPSKSLGEHTDEVGSIPPSDATSEQISPWKPVSVMYRTSHVGRRSSDILGEVEV